MDFTCLIQIRAALKEKSYGPGLPLILKNLHRALNCTTIFKFISAKIRESEDQNILVRNFVNPLHTGCRIE